MIFRNEARSNLPQPDLTPLINSVFLLLVFFMLAGSLKPAESIGSAKVNSQRPVEIRLASCVRESCRCGHDRY